MRRLLCSIRRFAGDQAGQTNIEWVLAMCGFGLPMIYTFGVLLSALVEHYRRVAFLEALPFP